MASVTVAGGPLFHTNLCFPLVTAVWPGSSLHYTEVLATPRFEDYYIEYYGPSKNNRWAYLGMSFTRGLVKQTDLSPWLNNQDHDPAWLRAMGIN